MSRVLVIDADAANRLSLGGALPDDWVDHFEAPPGIERVVHNGTTYLIGAGSLADSRLLVIASTSGTLFNEIPRPSRLECFQRVLRAALSQFRPGFVKIP